MEFDNIETIKQAVQIGAGVSVLPGPTVRDEVRNGSLAAVRLIAPELHRPIGIIYRQRRVLTPTRPSSSSFCNKLRANSRRKKRCQEPFPGRPTGCFTEKVPDTFLPEEN